LVIPPDFTVQLTQGHTPQVVVYTRGSQDVQDLLSAAFQSAAQVPVVFHQQTNLTAAQYQEQTGQEGTAFGEQVLETMLASRKEPEITVEKLSAVPYNSYTQSAPGMILQFAISGMVGIAAILVEEKTEKTFNRIRGTGTSSLSYLVGHGLSFLCLLVIQFSVLILFGQFFLDLAYFQAPWSTLLVAGSIIVCFTAMGLLLGVLAKNMGQSIVFSLLAMFLFSAVGGAWVPLEAMGAGMQIAGKFSPVSWGMQGFKSILINAAGVNEVLQPVWMLGIFTVVFMTAAVILYQLRKEKS
jgi:ABC-2 type transport system permease protein